MGQLNPNGVTVLSNEIDREFYYGDGRQSNHRPNHVPYDGNDQAEIKKLNDAILVGKRILLS